MDLVNKTPLAADLAVGSPPGQERRIGAVLAKATYRLESPRSLALETQEPMPLLQEDEETNLGLRPRDDLVRDNGAFEVILLGMAYVPGQTLSPATMVTMRLGRVERQLLAVGNRRWESKGLGGTVMTDPEAFARMPMTWEKAFGGSVEVLVDEGSVVEVAHPQNQKGKGFDALAAAEGLGKALDAPSGYPTLDYERELPNLEDPNARIGSPDDEPRPTCWATVPMGSGLHSMRVTENMDGDEMTSEQLIQQDRLLYRAHPDWVIERPPAGATLSLTNATPDGHLEFDLPELRVMFDYINRGKTATRELMPQMLVLYPEEQKLTLTYRKPFTYPFEESAERCIRIRTEKGWYQS
ncbi:DUF2169 domain-containing protein [Salinibacter ruber]|jgi:hypothetical protein|uniref:DUF2169 domain-containing protein n=1 Tax=Salinibacter ruber TaxID=146919 RepID=UPI000E6D1AE9|nr:DUF2169 domain-containing protein [Salinibacter ruber]